MSNYYVSLVFYFFLWLLNFCDTAYSNSKRFIEGVVNKQLEGRVLYYAMYSKEDPIIGGNYYTRLYDYTSLWNKLKLIILNFIYFNYYDNNSVFLYTDVYSNIENLTSFMIDAVVVSYIKDGVQQNVVLSCKDGSEDAKNEHATPGFIYAIVVDSEEKEHDMTKVFNMHKCCIINSPLKIYDFIYIFNQRYIGNKLVDVKSAYLKTMLDNDFDELLLKGNDQLYS
jgi:hypothetical protein